ncbi:MAG: response regulator [Gammaproteobacteria bacterium]|nr:response regulator [Gammaproteobacteria bacterium]
MATSQAEATHSSARGAWNLGVRARLLLAFFGIAAFAVVAAAAGIYAFREVGGRLDVVDARIPTTLSALELSRSAERIIAAAPALLAATERTRRDEVKAELAAEIERLNGKLRELEQERAQALPLGRIEPLVSSLTANLADLENLVARRLEASQRIATLRRGVFQTNDETQRLLAPWLEVVGSEIDALVEARNATPRGRGDQAPRLASLIELQALMQSAQAEVSAVADMLAEASTTDEPSRLRILVFQLDLALRDLESTAAGLDPKLRPLFLEQVAKLRAFTDGANAIAKAREQELALVGEGRELLAGTRRLSAQLTHAVDELGSAAKGDIGEAIRAALSVQQLSTHALVVVVAMSLVTSVLIVWLYVGRNIVRRLTALSDSMLAIAGGRLDAPVAVKGADEIAAMARAVEVFRRNTLERDGFEIANKYKSHVLASASHDLRQPLHALNLFVAQLRAESDPEERKRLVPRINAAVSSMNELFDALLDMSKLDAGVLQPNPSEFPIEPLLTRMETTFADTAREKGLRLSVVTSSAWVRSDFVLLERILLNLVSNAVRYTKHGGVVVGCRRRGGELRIDVCDSGPGIPKEQQRKIFGEFVQLGAASSERRGGLGLGLSIIDRLARLLEHPLEVNSRVGGGSRFSITVPLAVPRSESTEAPASIAPVTDPARGKRIVVIDDDALVLDGMADVLRSWGCEVVTAGSGEAALAELTAQRHKPDLIISDYRLADGKTGIDAIERLRGEWGAAIPAFLISGDTAPERLREASASGYHLLHKPVTPLRLRAMVNQLLKGHEAADGAGPPIRRPAAARRPASWPR